jgi:hypothetical protein
MHKTIEASPQEVSGYSALAASCNRILDQTKKLFEDDEAFKDATQHLSARPPHMSDDILEHFGHLRADIVVLKASVISFFEFYSPQEEKRQIGLST